MAKLFFSVAVLLFIIGFLEETECVSLQILSHTEEKYSDCISGLLDGKDRYIYSSAIDTTTFAISERRIIAFEMKRSTTDIFDPICSLNIQSAACSDSPQDGCYCKSNTNSVLNVILNMTAKVLYSNSIARLYLSDPNTGKGDYSNNQTVPVVQSDFTEVLTLNGKTVNLNSCDFEQQSSLTLKWCVTGLSYHNLRIFSGELILSEGENCVNYTFNSSNKLNSINVSFNELNNCQRNRTHSCLWKELTTTTPTTLNTTNATSTTGSSSKAKEDDKTGAIVGGVIGGVVFIVVIGVIVFLVFKYKKRVGNIKRKPSTDGEPPKEPETHPATRTVNDKASNMASQHPKAISSHRIVIDPEIESNSKSSAAPSNEQDSPKKKKKKSRRTKRSQKNNTENNATSSATIIEDPFQESEYTGGKINQTNQGVDSFKKRPPSVEITNNPNHITPRPLPQIRGRGEPKMS